MRTHTYGSRSQTRTAAAIERGALLHAAQRSCRSSERSTPSGRRRICHAKNTSDWPRGNPKKPSISPLAHARAYLCNDSQTRQNAGTCLGFRTYGLHAPRAARASPRPITRTGRSGAGNVCTPPPPRLCMTAAAATSCAPPTEPSFHHRWNRRSQWSLRNARPARMLSPGNRIAARVAASSSARCGGGASCSCLGWPRWLPGSCTSTSPDSQSDARAGSKGRLTRGTHHASRRPHLREVQ